jgi:hypothetical protein
MQTRLTERIMTWRFLLSVLLAGVALYVLVPSCMGFVPDEDDTLCHAIDAAEDGLVDWPDDEPDQWWGAVEKASAFAALVPKAKDLAFDHMENNPWYGDQAACEYMHGFLAGGDGWGEMGQPDPMSVDADTGIIDTPMGRTYNAYANLIYAGSQEGEAIRLDRHRALDDWSYYDSFLTWSVAFVYQNTFRVNARCRRDCAYQNCTIGQCKPDRGCCIARTGAGRAARQKHTDLYQTYFYDIDSVWRASSIVHEVRHARKGYSHTGAQACPRHSSCDRRWSNAGANTYETMWLAAFAQTPHDHHFVSPARRDRAQSRLRYMLAATFVDPPRWNQQSFVAINLMPEFYLLQGACSENPAEPHHCLILAN